MMKNRVNKKMLERIKEKTYQLCEIGKIPIKGSCDKRIEIYDRNYWCDLLTNTKRPNAKIFEINDYKDKIVKMSCIYDIISNKRWDLIQLACRLIPERQIWMDTLEDNLLISESDLSYLMREAPKIFKPDSVLIDSLGDELIQANRCRTMLIMCQADKKTLEKVMYKLVKQNDYDYRFWEILQNRRINLKLFRNDIVENFCEDVRLYDVVYEKIKMLYKLGLEFTCGQWSKLFMNIPITRWSTYETFCKPTQKDMEKIFLKWIPFWSECPSNNKEKRILKKLGFRAPQDATLEWFKNNPEDIEDGLNLAVYFEFDPQPLEEWLDSIK